MTENRVHLVAGLDEVGMGPLAGPAVFQIVVLRSDSALPVRDSKKLSNEARYNLALDIMCEAEYRDQFVASVLEIDAFGMGQVWQENFRSLLVQCDWACPAETVILDGDRKVLGLSGVTYMVGADDKIKAVSAASILAKCAQVQEMDYLDSKFPEYGFACHHGYGTAVHIAAIQKWGAVRGIHRKKYVETVAKNKNFKLRWVNT